MNKGHSVPESGSKGNLGKAYAFCLIAKDRDDRLDVSRRKGLVLE